MIVCPFCYKRFHSKINFIFHIKMQHKVMMLSVCKCYQNGCSRIFNNFYAYKSHLFLKHCISFNRTEIQNKNYNIANRNVSKLENLTASSPASINSFDEFSQAGCSFNKPSVSNIENFEFIVQKEISSFVSQLYSISIFPRSFIFNLINNLYNHTLIPILQQKCNSTDPKQSLSDLTKMLTIMQNGFDFKTDHQSLKYFESSGALIKPQSSINIFASLSSRLTGGKRKVLIVSNIEIQVISIKMILKKFLELPNILSTILVHIQECKRSEAIVSNLQGELWKNIELKFEGKFVLPLLLYFDDVEINNPLGSHANIHKLGAIYFSLMYSI